MPSSTADPSQHIPPHSDNEPSRRHSGSLAEVQPHGKNDLSSRSNSIGPPDPATTTTVPSIHIPSTTSESSENEAEANGSTVETKPTTPETINMETFQQILDLDEDEGHEFSRGMAWAYFSQVDTTFVEMDQALVDKDLAKLSSLGHFLKGSSAALGVSKVQASCERIQHYGQLRDEEVGQDLTDKVALDKIEWLLGKVKVEYAAAEKWLRKWYDDDERQNA